jgi:GTPase SAR1 family protein
MMGGCISNESEHYAGAVSSSENNATNRQLHRLNRDAGSRKTLLLLGTGESGKSTFFRQLKLVALKINRGNITPEELVPYRPLIFRQILREMTILINEAQSRDWTMDSAKNIAYAGWLQNVPTDGSAWNADCITVIQLLWADSAIRKAYEARGSTYHISDSAAYFFENVARFTSDCIPTKQDIVRVRVRTTGIDEAPLNWQSFHFSLVDVGGQRTERKKWMHMFEDRIDAVIFCVSMADYDLTLREDNTTNRLKESLALFQETCRNPCFGSVYMFLLLNKMDIFEEKIKSKDPKDFGFDDYKGGKDKEAAKRYFRRHFEVLHPDHSKLFINDSVAINSDNVKFVFEAIRDELVKTIIDNSVMI